jgi:hypothetical protein
MAAGSRPGGDDRVGRLLVALAAAALVVGVGVARGRPPQGYEPSIYRATPAPFWAGVGLAWVVGLVVALSTRDRWARLAATGVGGLAATSVVGLPLVRGYRFNGSADSLTHLGWVRDLDAGRIAATELFYPAVHSTAVVVADTAGLTDERATMLVVLVVAVAYFLAVPAAVWALTGGERATVVGAFSAFALLPINVVVTEPVVHPITQASLFVAVVCYLVVRYLTAPAAVSRPTPLGATLAVASVGLVLVHPQAALATVVVLGTAALAQTVARRAGDWPSGADDDAGRRLRSLHGQVLFLAVVFLLWAGRQEAFTSTVELAGETLAVLATGRSTTVAGEVSQRGGSLAAIGASLFEVYLKLFLAVTVYGLLSVGLAVRAGRLARTDPATARVVRLLVAGLFALGAFAALHLLGPLSALVYRYASVGATVVTVVGAVALYRATAGARLTGPLRTLTGRLPLVVAVLAVLALSVPTVFASPYVYQPSTQVDDARLAGYEAAFEHAPDDARFYGVRWSAWRYRQAIEGTVGTPSIEGSLAPEQLNATLGTQTAADRYVVVTEFDYDREVVVYRELRYDRRDFETIATRPALDRVRANGGFVLYYDRADDDAGTGTGAATGATEPTGVDGG